MLPTGWGEWESENKVNTAYADDMQGEKHSDRK